MRHDGKFMVNGDIPEGQGSVTALLSECFDLAYELRADAEREEDDEDEEDDDEDQTDGGDRQHRDLDGDGGPVGGNGGNDGASKGDGLLSKVGAIGDSVNKMASLSVGGH